jgi:TolB-like protein/Flp pilus assembly protein TadD
MSDVFISYARSTASQAQMVAEALRGLGYGVWLDDALPAHLAFADVIEERLQAAKAVVVIWSADAVNSQWVRSEANRAREDGKLIQVTIDGERLPMPFEQIHCADLSEWSGDPAAPEWKLVLSSIATLMNGAARPTERNGAPIGPAVKPGEGPRLSAPVRPSIAVLPFKNMSGDPEQEYLADAISEDIVTALSRWRWFFVIARHTCFRYKDRDVDVGLVGNELGVRYVLEGSVRKAGNRVRVTAQLVDTATGSNVWADQFNRDLVDVLALQDEITEQVVAAIEPAMLQGEGARAAHKSLTDFSGLDCFYRAMWHLNKLTEEGDNEALGLFREAIRRDPELSLGHIGLARVLYGRAIFGLSDQPNETLREARAAAQTAIGLDARDAYGYFAYAGASLYLADHRAALDNAQRAITLNPNFAYGHYRLGQVLVFGGRPAEAIAPIERSLRFSPYDPQLGLMRETLALANYQARDYEAAVNHATAAVHTNDSSGSAVLAASLARLGRTEEAAEAFKRSRRWSRPSTARPLAAPYADPAQREHLREGLRLAGAGRPD